MTAFAKPGFAGRTTLAVHELKSADPESPVRNTPEGAAIKLPGTAEDLAGVEHLDTLPELPPCLCGTPAMMYAARPRTVRRYAGFSAATASRAPKVSVRALSMRCVAPTRRMNVVIDGVPTRRGDDVRSCRRTGVLRQGQRQVAVEARLSIAKVRAV